MNLIDVYICSNPEQTGIGAVNSLLLLGKKMYLKGKNFEYALGIGCSVHNVKDILRQDYEDFVKPDSKLIQNQNRDAIQKMYSQAYDKWSLYFKQINLVSSK